MKFNLEKIKEIGFVESTPDKSLNLIEEIKRLRTEKNAVILAHYYVEAELQEVADFVGDSLALSQQAAETDADMIVFVGVHFMAETAKILSPNKKVVIPDLKAGCSLAESAPTESFTEFVNNHPDHIVISYVNTTAETKALTDIVCTSSNAVEIVESYDKDQKIIFGPDKNLGNYINSVTGRDMLLWDGACHVHHRFSLERILEFKNLNPDAKIIAHPECPRPILLTADFIGSTSALLNFSTSDPTDTFIVATESGILHQMRKESPKKNFIAAPPEDSTCACNDCNYMKLNSVRKLYNALKFEQPEVQLDEDLRVKAYQPIRKMLDLSKKLGL